MLITYIWRSGFIPCSIILPKTVIDPCSKTEGHTVQFKLDQFMQLQDKTMVQCAKNKYIHHVLQEELRK